MGLDVKNQLRWLVCYVVTVLLACSSSSQQGQDHGLELNSGDVAVSSTRQIDDFDDNWNNLGTQQFAQQVAEEALNEDEELSAEQSEDYYGAENQYAQVNGENSFGNEYANFEEDESVGQYAAQENEYDRLFGNENIGNAPDNLLANVQNQMPTNPVNSLLAGNSLDNYGGLLGSGAQVPAADVPAPALPAVPPSTPPPPPPVSPFEGPAIHELTWVGFDYNKDARIVRVDLKTKGDPVYQVLQETNQAGQPELVIRYLRTKLRRKIRRDIDASEFRSPIAYIRMRQSGNKTDVVLTLRNQVKPRIFAKNGDMVLTVTIPDDYMGSTSYGDAAVVAQAQVLSGEDLMPQYETGSDLPLEMEQAALKQAYVPTIASDALQAVPADGGELIDPATLPPASAPLAPLPVAENSIENTALPVLPPASPVPVQQDVAANLVPETAETPLPPVVHQNVQDLPVPGQQQIDDLPPADTASQPKVAVNGYNAMNEVAIPEINEFEFSTPPVPPAEDNLFGGGGNFYFDQPTQPPAAAAESYGDYYYEEYENYEDDYEDFENFEENLDDFDDYDSEINKFEVRARPSSPFDNSQSSFDIAGRFAKEKVTVIGVYDVVAVAQDGFENPVEDFGGFNTGNFSNISNEVLNDLPLENPAPVNNFAAPLADFPVNPGSVDQPYQGYGEEAGGEATGVLAADPYEVEGQDQAIPPAGSLGGREVSLDFRAAPLSDVIRVLSEESGINFVMPDNLNDKKVTVTLQNVPFNDALKGVLNAHGLGLIEISPNLVRIDTNDNLTKTREQDEKRKEVETRLQPTKVLTYPLSYYDAEAAKGMLQQLLSGLAKADTRITVDFDKRTNTVIVNATPNTLNMAKTLLERLDRETPQIKISSRIVEVTQKFGEILGLNWDFKSLNDQGRGLGFGNLVFPNYALSRFSVDTGGLNPDVAGKPRIALGSLNNSLALDIALAMEETRGTTEILQSSDMMVEDNRKAKIVAGSRDYMKPAIPAGVTVETAPDYKEINYDLTVEVTPRATADGSIRMEFNIKSETPGTSSTAGAEAAVDKREMNTVVLKKNGETAVIGGVYTTDRADKVTGVPFFSSIPIIGALFRGSETRETKKELLVMVTPSIVTNVGGVSMSTGGGMGFNNFGNTSNNYGGSQEFNWEQTGTNEAYSNNYGDFGTSEVNAYESNYGGQDNAYGSDNAEFGEFDYEEYENEYGGSYNEFNDQANFNVEEDNGFF